MVNKTEFSLHLWNGEPEVLGRFAELLSQVYNRPITESHLIWKHRNNPIGQSLISYAENDQGEMVAARAFWPMYSKSAPIYQPCDTVTRPDFQRKGLFSALTKLCLRHVPSNSAIVNFPNNNSYPAYLKLGWQCYGQNRKVIGLGLGWGQKPISDLGAYLDSSIDQDRQRYLLWRFSPDSGHAYQFFAHPQGVVVANGKHKGLIAFTEQERLYGGGLGLNTGYVLPDFFSLFNAITTGVLPLPCSSKTAFYLMPAAHKDTLIDAFSHAQINTLMDTF